MMSFFPSSCFNFADDERRALAASYQEYMMMVT
jgi:hypothetical protein